ncbi:hypothetical protein SMICM304S_04099 [Streptomyces microflavus]
MSAAQYPAVSVIMPVLNEERHLRNSVRHILEQEYAGEMEVVIALGPSADRTDEIAAELVAEDPRVHTVPNPTGRTPAALNAAIEASRHPVVVHIVDQAAHALPELHRDRRPPPGGDRRAERRRSGRLRRSPSLRPASGSPWSPGRRSR